MPKLAVEMSQGRHGAGHKNYLNEDERQRVGVETRGLGTCVSVTSGQVTSGPVTSGPVASGPVPSGPASPGIGGAQNADLDGGVNVQVKHVDMPPEMQQDAVALASHAVATFGTETEMASYIKREFDRRHGGKWHCVIGRAYASYVTHDSKKFIYFQVGNEVILLFKST